MKDIESFIRKGMAAQKTADKIIEDAQVRDGEKAVIENLKRLGFIENQQNEHLELIKENVELIIEFAQDKDIADEMKEVFIRKAVVIIIAAVAHYYEAKAAKEAA